MSGEPADRRMNGPDFTDDDRAIGSNFPAPTNSKINYVQGQIKRSQSRIFEVLVSITSEEKALTLLFLARAWRRFEATSLTSFTAASFPDAVFCGRCCSQDFLVR